MTILLLRDHHPSTEDLKESLKDVWLKTKVLMWQMCQQNNQLYERLCVLRAHVVIKQEPHPQTTERVNEVTRNNLQFTGLSLFAIIFILNLVKNVIC